MVEHKLKNNSPALLGATWSDSGSRFVTGIISDLYFLSFKFIPFSDTSNPGLNASFPGVAGVTGVTGFAAA